MHLNVTPKSPLRAFILAAFSCIGLIGLPAGSIYASRPHVEAAPVYKQADNWQRNYLRWHPNAPLLRKNYTISGTGAAAGPLWSFATTQQSPITGGLACALCFVETPLQAIDGDTLTASRLVLPVGVAGSVGQLLQFAGDYQPGDLLALDLEIPGQIYTKQLLSAVNIETFKDSVSNNDVMGLNGSLVRLQALGIGVGSTNKFRVIIPVSKSFNAVKVSLGALFAEFGTLKIYEAAAIIPATIAPTSPQITAGQQTTLSSAIRIPGATFKWYTTPSGGTPVFTGANFTTPVLSKTITYYVEAATPDNLNSYVRIPVTVKVRGGAGALWSYADTEQSPVTGGIACALCYVDSASQAIDGDTTTASRLVLPVGVATTLGQRLYFPGNYLAGDQIALDLEVPSQLISGQLLGGINIETYKDSVSNNDRTYLNGSLVKVQVLGLGTGNTNKFRAIIPVTKDFNAVQVNISSLIAGLGSLKIYEAAANIPVTVSPASPVITSGQSAALTASLRLPNAQFKWYTQASGGTPVYTGAGFTTPPLTKATTYYVEATTPDALGSYVRTPVTVKVAGAPGPIWSYGDDQQSPLTGGVACALCAINNPLLAVDGDTTTASGFSIPVGVLGTVGQLVKFPGVYYPGDSVVLIMETPDNLLTGQLLPGISVQTYNNAILGPGTPNNDEVRLNASIVRLELLGLGVGNNRKFKVTIPVKDTFDAVRVNLAPAASLSLAEPLKLYEAAAMIPVTVNPSPAIANYGKTATLTPSIRIPNATFNWYVSPTGGTPIATGPFTTPPLTRNTTYYVEAVDPLGKTSFKRTTVPVKVGGGPGPLWTYGIEQQSPRTGGIACALCSVEDPNMAVDEDTGTCSRLNMPAGLSTFVGQYIRFPGTYQAGDSVVLFLGTKADPLANAGLLTGIRVQTYLGDTPNNDAKTLNSALIKLRVLGFSDGIYHFRITFPVAKTFDGTQVDLVSLVGLSDGLYVCEAAAMMPVQVARITPSTDTVDAGKTASFTASLPRIPDAVFNWYETPTGGTPVYTGPNFTTPPLLKDKTYYVEVFSPGDGLKSIIRTVVPVIVRPANSLACGAATVQSAGTSGIACLGCAVANGPLAVDNNVNTASELRVGIGLLGGVFQGLGFPTLSGVADTLRIGVGTTTRLLDAGLLGGLTFTLYNGTTQVKQYNNTSLLNLRLLGDTTHSELIFAPGVAFDSIKIDYNALLAAISQFNIYYAKATPPNARVQDSVATVCKGGSVTLTAIAPAGATFRWFSQYTGGTAIHTGAAFTVSNITKDTTFYVEATSTGGAGCGSNTRTPVSVRFGLPGVEVAPTNIKVSKGQTATFKVVNPKAAYTYKWFKVDTGGTAIGTGAQFITPAVDSNSTFYVEADSVGCTSKRTAVYVTISDMPAPPDIVPDTAFVSPGQTATFRIANPDPTLTYRWYNTDSGGTVLATDTMYTTPAVTANGRIYAEAVNAAGQASTRSSGVIQLITGPGGTIPCTYTNAQESPVYIGLINLCLLCGVTEPGNAIDGDLNTSSKIRTTIGTGSIGQMLHFQQPGVAGDSIRLTLGLPTGLADAQLLGGVRVQTYNAGKPVGQPVFLNAGLLRLSLINGNKFEAVLPATATYDAVLVTLGGVLTALTTMEIYNAEQFIIPAKPEVDADSLTVCLGSSAKIVTKDTAGTTVKWYATANGTTPLFTGGTFNTPVLNQPSTTYYIETSRNGCANPVRVPVTVKAVASPDVPQLTAAGVNICVGQTATLSVASPQAGLTYKWYDAATGGTLVDSGAVLTVTPSATGVDTVNYYVEAGVGTCSSSSRAKANVYVSTKCGGGGGGGDTTAITLCKGNSTTLKVDSVQTGATYRWYNTANNSLVFTGTSFTTPVLNANINYLLEATLTGGTKDTVQLYQLTVADSLATPGLVASEVITTPGGTATFIIANPLGGVMYKWYNVATGGTAVDTGTSFTTPPLAGDSAKYYVEASAGTCASGVRGIATVKVSGGGGGVPCYTANSTQSPVYTAPISICLLCGVTDANNAVDGDTTTSSKIRANLGIGYIGQILHFKQPGLAGDSIRLVMALPGGFTDVQLLGGVRVQTYNGGNPAGNPVFLNGGFGLVRFTLLSGNKFIATIPAPANYDAVYVSIGGVLTALTTLEVFNAEQKLLPAKPDAGADSVTACIGKSTKLVARDTAGVTVKWYAAATGGAALFTGAVFNTPVITQAITTYYIETSRNGCANPVRIPVTVKANSNCSGGPGGDTTAVTICRGTSTTLEVDSVQTGATYQWYNAANDSLVGTGTSFTTPVLNTNTTYRLIATFTGGVKDTVQIYPVTVTDPPTVPVLTNSTFISCSGGPATLSVLNPQAGITYNWYDAATGGNLVGTGATLSVTPPAGQDSVKYYAAAAVGSCTSSSRATATVKVVSSLPTPALVMNEQNVNTGGTATFTIANPQAGITYKWYNAATGGTPIDSGTTFTTPPLTGDSATYYVEASAGSCVSGTRAIVRVKNNNNGGPGGDTTAVTICRGTSTTLEVDSVQTGATYQWYNAADNSLVGTGTSFTTPVLNTNTTYRLIATFTGGLKDTVQIYPVTVTDPPTVPVLTNSTFISCSGGPATLSVLNPQAGITYNWYDAATGGNLVGTGATLSVTPPAGQDSVKYYAAAAVGSCTSSSRATATVKVVSSLPTPALVMNEQNVNTGGTATFTIANPLSGVTYKWYNAATGGTPIDSGTTFTTPPLTGDSATYYVEASAGSCVSGTRAIVRVKNNNSGGGGDTTAVSICRGNSATLTVTNPVAGATYRWYNTANNSQVGTGTSFTTPVLNANANYLLEATLPGGAKDTVQTYAITVTDPPIVPVLVNSTVIGCGSGPVQLAVQNPIAGITYNWYDAATGGSLVGTGATLNVTPPAGQDSVKYYAEAAAGNCTSSSRATATVKVLSSLQPPVLTMNQQSVNLGGTATFTIANPQGGVTYKWYSTATGGTPLAIGSSFTTPPLAGDSVKYYVEASVGTCVSSTRGVVTVKNSNNSGGGDGDTTAITLCTSSSITLNVVNPQAGATYRWYNTANNSLVFTGNSFTTPVLTANITYLVQATLQGGAKDTNHVYQITVGTNTTPPVVVASTVKICSGQDATLIVQNPLPGFTYQWYDAAAGGSLVYTGPVYKVTAVTANKDYYVQSNLDNKCVSATRTRVSIQAGSTPAAPTVASNNVITCIGGTATFNIQNPDPAVTYRWYNQPGNGTLLAIGTAYTTAGLTSTATFYVEAALNAGCVSTARTGATATVVSTLDAPEADAITACSGQSAVLKVKNPKAGLFYKWYSTASGGTALFTGNTYTTAPRTVNTIYYLEASSGGGCVSVSRTPVSVTVNNVPAIPAVQSEGIVICPGQTATLSVQNPAAGLTYRWYTSPTGGTAATTGASFTTGALTANQQYYVEAVNASGCASNERTAVSITVGAPNADDITVNVPDPGCPDGQVTLTATAASVPGAVFRWYNVATGGTQLATGATFTTPALAVSTTYYVEVAANGGCISATRKAVTVGVLQQLVTPVVTISDSSATSVTFRWNAIAGVTRYEVSTDNGVSFVTPSSGANGTTHTVANLSPNKTVTLRVKAVSTNSCQTSELSAAITGKATNPAGDQVFIPNLFSPNGDGVNDVLKVFGNTIATVELHIYNSWGQEVFVSKDQSRGWDGTMSGKQQPAGVYVYIVRVTLQNGTIVNKKGNTTVIR